MDPHTESTVIIFKAFIKNLLPTLQFPSADKYSTPNNDNLEDFLGRPPFDLLSTFRKVLWPVL